MSENNREITMENIMETRKCKKCGVEKELTSEFFRQDIRSSGVYFYPKCKICMDEQQKEYYQENREGILEQKQVYHQENKEQSKAYRQENKEEIKKQKAVYRQENKEEIKKQKKAYNQENKEKIKKQKAGYYQENKEEIKKRNNKWGKEKRKNDPSFRLRKNVSNSINKELKKNGSSKNGKSIMNYLPYTLEQLKAHLENKFEDWMTWENQGTYNLDKWDDADPKTWKWQIDHITPHSTFKYESMDSQEFRDCWALDNLRPYSAKQNNIDGARRDADQIQQKY
jgi:hypothetical protein